MTYPISPNASTNFLEQEAAEQRRRIHNTVAALREQVKGTIREKLDVQKRAREYVWPAAGTAFLFSVIFGYGTAGTIKHMVR
jgi:hypothetical protein